MFAFLVSYGALLKAPDFSRVWVDQITYFAKKP